MQRINQISTHQAMHLMQSPVLVPDKIRSPEALAREQQVLPALDRFVHSPGSTALFVTWDGRRDFATGEGRRRTNHVGIDGVYQYIGIFP